jgi:two-component sensor histidine kinase
VDGAMVQTFALVLHELATNAAKHGALSNGAGNVSVSWSIAGAEDGDRFRFEWREEDGPAVEPPTRKGFGSSLLESAIAVESVHPRLSFSPDGFRYEIDAPLSAIGTKA